MLNTIQRCFSGGKVLYTRHARDEMRTEPFGKIRAEAVLKAVMAGELIERYENDKPYPSVLIYGTTYAERPLHLVCAYSREEDLAIIVTAYQPDLNLWIEYRRRR